MLTTDAAIALANVSQSSDASLQSAYRDMPLITIHSVLRSCEAAKTPIEGQQAGYKFSNINNFTQTLTYFIGNSTAGHGVENPKTR